MLLRPNSAPGLRPFAPACLPSTRRVVREYGICMTVWPQLSDKSTENLFKLFPPRSKAAVALAFR